MAIMLYTVCTFAQHPPNPELDLLIEPTLDYELMEAINTTEDLIEWITNDLESGEISYDQGNGYLENLNETLTRLKIIENARDTVSK